MVLDYLNRNGVATHFVERLGSNDQLCRKVETIALEVIVRNVIAGSMAKRLGLEEGIVPENTIFDICLHSELLGDPLINDHHAVALGIATYEELATIYELSAKINSLLVALYKQAGITLVDELTPDTCRLWDTATGERLDKDRFRRDLGRVRETYEEVAKRLSNVLNK